MSRRGSALLLGLLLIGPGLEAATTGSRNFDDANDRLDMGNTNNVTTGDVSLCTWVKMTEDATADAMIGKKSAESASNAGYSIRQNTTDSVNFNVSDATNLCAAQSTTDPDGIWTHYCGSWDNPNDSCLIYLNGAQDGTGTNTSTGSLSTTSAFRMGETGGSSDDANMLAAHGLVALRVLTPVEVAEAMWKPVQQTVNGLWMLWGNDPEPDLSGSGFNGNVTGTAGTSTDGPPIFFAMGGG